MNRFLSVLLSLIFVFPLHAQKQRAVTSSPTSIRIGALVSTTGDWSTLGNGSVAALELATRDINAEMEALRLPYRVETFAEDTALVPSKALEKLMAMQNVGFVIGPQSSAEAGAVLPFANANHVVLISQGSTAS